MSSKRVYFFGDGQADGNAGLKNLLGGKGANLAEMVSLGVPVPPGFTVTTEQCIAYQQSRELSAELKADVKQALAQVEKVMDRRFADANDPLLFSVRSGARVSMPGMMDTVLNLGLNDQTVEGLAKRSGEPRFAYDSYRRLLQMYGDVVMGVDSEHFEDAIDALKSGRGVQQDTDLGVDDLKALIATFKALIAKHAGSPFPTDPFEQLWGGIRAVFESWNAKRAIEYRRINGIPSDWGTAVNVQAMVFGNLGESSATGVAFTRDPSTGARSSTASTWSTPRARTWWRARVLRSSEHRRSRLPAGRKRGAGSALARGSHAGGLRRTRCDPHAPRDALQGHAGHRVHDPGRAPVDAADAQRQAHRHGGDPHRRRIAGRGPDRRRTRRCCGSSRPIWTSCCTTRSIRQRRSRPWGPGLPASPGAAQRPGRLHRRGRGEAGGRRAAGAAGAQGDQPRGYRGHERGAGDPDRARRHDEPRGGRRPRHGQALRGGVRRAVRRRRQGRDDDRRQDLPGRRLDHHRRDDRRRDRRPPGAGAAASGRSRICARSWPGPTRRGA